MSQRKDQWDESQDDMLGGAQSTLQQGTFSADDIDEKVKRAQQLLMELKNQQDHLEREQKDLVELRQKQLEFEEGRRMMLDKLTRGLVVLQQQEIEIKREAEQIQMAGERFNEQLTEIEAINPSQWDGASLSDELTRALAKIDQARLTYDQTRVRLEALRDISVESPGSESEPDDSESNGLPSFSQMMRMGFAYTLPLIIMMALIWMWLVMRGLNHA